jgi:hypothetical protein
VSVRKLPIKKKYRTASQKKPARKREVLRNLRALMEEYSRVQYLPEVGAMLFLLVNERL